MILSSKPKPVNFRIVLNNTEITSIESLRDNFDLERLVMNDQTQLISWLKRVDRIKGDKIEANLSTSGEVTNLTVIKTLSILYDRDFDNMVEYVDYLYENHYEESKQNFIRFVCKHGEWLREFFPLDSISLEDEDSHLNDFFKSIRNQEMTQETKRFMAQLYYRAGDLQMSQEIDPPYWELKVDEINAIKAISSGIELEQVNELINSNHLSLMGVEFIFLCSFGYSLLNKNDSYVKSISELIDNKPVFSSLRNRLGESLGKIINKKKGLDFEHLLSQLGYMSPNSHDPLFNEKLFLSSLIVKNKRETLLNEICEKNDYFPAQYLLEEDDYESKELKKRDESLYKRWFKRILDYNLSPRGIDGDIAINLVREEAIIAYQFKQNPSFMREQFCDPQKLKTSNEYDIVLQRRIQRLQNKLTNRVLSDPPELSNLEEKYVNFFKQAYSIIMNLSSCFVQQEYSTSLQYSTVGSELIRKSDETDAVFGQENLSIADLLIIIRHGKKSSVMDIDKKLKENYSPLKAIFQDLNKTLSDNDKRILDYNYLQNNALILDSNWSLLNKCTDQIRIDLIQKYLKRWIANFIYYINPNPDQQ